MSATVVATKWPAVTGRFGLRVYCAATIVYLEQAVGLLFDLIVKAAPRDCNRRGHGKEERTSRAPQA